jgi:hypothetical protein
LFCFGIEWKNRDENPALQEIITHEKKQRYTPVAQEICGLRWMSLSKLQKNFKADFGWLSKRSSKYPKKFSTASGWKNGETIKVEIVHKIWQVENGRKISWYRRLKCCGIQNPKFQLNCSLKPAGRTGDFQ